MKLTIGIPTYNRAPYCEERIDDLSRLGYLGHRNIEIIIHDNDSTDKSHCKLVNKLQKIFNNIYLIESKPNIGMVRGCEKIIQKSAGNWITFLGDDDPILLAASKFIKILDESPTREHLFFKSYCRTGSKIHKLSWFPKLKSGNINTLDLCAKVGLTTHFAFLGAHCFRKKNLFLFNWQRQHFKSLFYGHCLVLLECYKKSFFTGFPLAAWNSGNERITHQQNLLRHLELKRVFSPPYSKNMSDFIKKKPLEVVEQGVFPLIKHINHPAIDLFNKFEKLPQKQRIQLKKIQTIDFKDLGDIHIFPSKQVIDSQAICFILKDSKKIPKKCSLLFECGTSTDLAKILKIIGFLELRGTIFIHHTKVSVSDLAIEYIFQSMFNARVVTERPETDYWIACSRGGYRGVKVIYFLILLYSTALFGFEKFKIEKILLNAFCRPRKGFYKILLETEKIFRTSFKALLGLHYYRKLRSIKVTLCHFIHKVFPLKLFKRTYYNHQ